MRAPSSSRFFPLLRLLATGAALAVLGACAETAAPTALDPGASSFSKAAQVAVCHRTGDGSYRSIRVNANALPGHTGHGDVPVGPAVAGGPECPSEVFDLVTVDGQPLPIVESSGTEILRSFVWTLFGDGSCRLVGTGSSVDEPEVVAEFATASCSYTVDGSAITFSLSWDEGMGEAETFTALYAEGRISFTNEEASYVFVRR